MVNAFIQIESASKSYDSRSGLFARGKPLRAVSDVSVEVAAGETLGLVGESGSGKTTLARMVLGVEPPTSGRVLVDGRDVGQLQKSGLRWLRRTLQPVLQDPYGSLNPRMRIGDIVGEPLVIHRVPQRHERVGHALERVGLAAGMARRFPGELSGGQRQRVAIARAIALQPRALVLDEPVSALDVSIQAQVLNLLKGLQRTEGLTYLLISHDLAVVAFMADRIGVLYMGKLVELGSRDAVTQTPRHPYTRALLAASGDARGTDLPLQGEVPSPLATSQGCPFRARCIHATELCRTAAPVLREAAPLHWAACHFQKENLDHGSIR